MDFLRGVVTQVHFRSLVYELTNPGLERLNLMFQLSYENLYWGAFKSHQGITTY